MVFDENRENLPTHLRRLKKNFAEIKAICSRASMANNFNDLDGINAEIKLLMNANQNLKKQTVYNNNNTGKGDNNFILRKIVEHVEKQEITIQRQQPQQTTVCRRKGVANNQHYIQQIKANDSLENFFQLMSNSNNSNNSKKQSKSKLMNKYSNSLFFKTTPSNNGPKTWISSETYGKLPVYDILDELNQEDVRPLKSEYPRKKELITSMPIQDITTSDNKNHKKQEAAEEKSIKRKSTSYLHNLVYLEDKHKAWEYLIQPPTITVYPVRTVFNDNVPTKDGQKSAPISPRKADDKNVRKALGPPSTAQKRVESRVESTTHRKRTVQATTIPSPKNEQKMLDKLRGLKEKNDVIQTNIQKAIDVIEAKMIDIISKPSESSSTEAFNIMEKEITKVLKMMNDDGSGKQVIKLEKTEKLTKIEKLEDEKLEKIIPEKDTNQQVVSTLVNPQPQVYSNLEESEKLGNEIVKIAQRIDEFCDKRHQKDDVLNFLDSLVMEDEEKPIEKQPLLEKTEDDILSFLDELDALNEETHQAICVDQVEVVNIPCAFQLAEVYDLNDILATSTLNFVKKQTDPVKERHIYILQRFYALFFLLTFFILNFDYC